MSGPQTPGPAVDPPAAGPGPRVPAPPRNDAGGTGDPASADLDAMRDRTNAATPGPWFRDPDRGWRVRRYPDESGIAIVGVGDQAAADAEFIAHAREDVPALLAEVARLRAERDEARAAIARVRALHGRTFQGVAKDVVERGDILAALEPSGGGT